MSQGSSTVAFNGVFATPTGWSSTSITVPVPAAAFSGPVVVTVAGAASNGYQFTTIPTLSSVSPTTGGIGSYITLTGSSFGPTRGTSTVTFNGTSANASGWSNTSILVSVPSNATTGPVLVTVGGQASNGVTFTFSNNGTLSGIVIRLSDGAPVVGVVVEALQQSSVKASATTAGNGSYSITGLAPGVYDVSAFPTGYLPVTNAGAIITANKTTTVNLSVGAPTVNTINPGAGPVGSAVTINGSGFGAVQGVGGVSFNGTAATVSSWSVTPGRSSVEEARKR